MLTMITVSLLIPISLYGQGGKTDVFFSNGSEGYENRGEGAAEITGGISNDPLGAAPLGSGLMVMTAAGAGYVLIKKRKRALTLMTLVALMLVMTQCKKNHNVAPNDKRYVNIILNVSGGSKVDVNPTNGMVTFEDNDEIIVANNGKYIGRLTCDDGVFSGSITNPSEDDYLHFYFLGNAVVNGLEESNNTECSVSISDQINSLPVISYGHSYEKYSSTTTAYEARLQNKCALVKFDVSTSSTFAATCITGMNNVVNISFNDASFTYSMENDGKITLPSGSGERWAILLPQDEVEAGTDGSAFSGRFKGCRGYVPIINADDCISNGISVVINTERQPEGSLNGLFTINSDGKQVAFAKSNLAYVKDKKEWRFFDKQYKTIEYDSQNIGDDCSNLDTITMFGWGQTGYNHGAISYMPYQTDKQLADYYAYGDPNCNLYDGNGTADWGYVAVTNGENANKQWRTLRTEEWYYIFAYREYSTQKYARATIVIDDNDYYGVVILPDSWTSPAGIVFKGGSDFTCSDNVFTLSEWELMEEAGAVFLPYAGYRYTFSSFGSNMYCYQWSSSAYNSKRAYMLSISNTNYQLQRNLNRTNGMPVRLVCE